MKTKKVKLIVSYDGSNFQIRQVKNKVGDLEIENTSDGLLKINSDGKFKAGRTSCVSIPTYGAPAESLNIDTSSLAPNSITIVASNNGVPSNTVFYNTSIFIEVDDSFETKII